MMRRLAPAAAAAAAASVLLMPAPAQARRVAHVLCISRGGVLHARTARCRPGEHTIARQASGASPAGTKLLYACVDRRGDMRIVGRRTRCRAHESKFAWALYSPPQPSVFKHVDVELSSEGASNAALGALSRTFSSGHWRGYLTATLSVLTEGVGLPVEAFCHVDAKTNGKSTEINSSGFSGVSGLLLGGDGLVGNTFVPVDFNAANTRLEVFCNRLAAGELKPMYVNATLSVSRIG